MAIKMKCAIVGPFDIFNYGDHIINIILEKEIKARVNDVEFLLFGINKSQLPIDSSRIVYSIDELNNVCESSHVDSIIIFGGSIIHFSLLTQYNQDDETIIYPIWKLWATASIVAAKNNIPLIWNNTEIPNEFSGWEISATKELLNVVDFIGVRNISSQTYLEKIGINNSIVNYDSAFLVNKLIDKKTLQLANQKLLKNINNYIVFHCNSNISEEDKKIIVENLLFLKEKGYDIVLLPLAYTNRDEVVLEEINQLSGNEFLLLKQKLSITEMVSIFSKCAIYIGISFHGAITAFSFGAEIIAYDYLNRTKTKELFDSLNKNMFYITKSEDLKETIKIALNNKNHEDNLKLLQIQKELNSHFDEIANIINGSIKKSTGNIDYNNIYNIIDFETKKNYNYEQEIRKISTDYSNCYNQFETLRTQYMQLEDRFNQVDKGYTICYKEYEKLLKENSILRNGFNSVNNQLNSSERLAIYFFYDKDGVVDDYICYLLTDLSKVLSNLVIVCNGKLNSEGRKKFLQFTENIVVRENKGFDVWAYKTGLDFFGWKELSKYNEVILLNFTIMGPVISFQEIFNHMDKKDVDFWGLNKHYGDKIDWFECNPYGYLPEHLQSHFIVFRNSIIRSAEFQNYWNNAPVIESYKHAVGKHESYITKYFSDCGFKWESYCNTDDLKEITPYPLMDMPVETLKYHSSPIFKRKSFFLERDHFILSKNYGSPASDLYDYLINNTNYDVSLIMQNIIRTSEQQDIISAMNMTYPITPSKSDSYLEVEIIIYFSNGINFNFIKSLLLFENKLNYCFIVSNKEEESQIESFIRNTNHRIVVIEEKTCNSLSFLINPNLEIVRNKYICIINGSINVFQNNIQSNSFYKLFFENYILNNEMLSGVIDIFNANKYLSLLIPENPFAFEEFIPYEYEWNNIKDEIQRISGLLNIDLITSYKKSPITPINNVFWMKSEVLNSLKDISKYNLLSSINENIFIYIISLSIIKDNQYSATCTTFKILNIKSFNTQWYIKDLVNSLPFNHNYFSFKQKLYSLVALEENIEKERYDYNNKLNEINNQNAKLQNQINYYMPRASLRVQIRLKLKRMLPKSIYGFIVKIKRTILGPKKTPYSYNENNWE